MDKKAAIEHLQRALAMAALPDHQYYAKDDSGEITAACPAFKVGSMQTSVRAALRELGQEVT